MNFNLIFFCNIILHLQKWINIYSLIEIKMLNTLYAINSLKYSLQHF